MAAIKLTYKSLHGLLTSHASSCRLLLMTPMTIIRANTPRLLRLATLALLGCGQAQTPGTPATSEDVVQWIRATAAQLTTTDPAAPLDDLAPLEKVVGSAAVVGLGEATHGSSELWTERHRVVRFLAERMGFTGLAMEMPALVGERLDTYVGGGGGELQAILAQSWPFNGPEIVAMFEWIKSYNADPSHPAKVRVTGMDVPWVAASVFDDVVRLVAVHAPAEVDTIRRAYAPVRKASLDTNYSAGGTSAAYASLSPATKGDFRSRAEAVEQIVMRLPSSPSLDSARAGARLISQVTRLWHLFETDPAGAFRDHERSMAANVLAFRSQVGRTAVWGHDGHVATWTMIPKLYADSMMGTYLRAELGTEYLSVGTSFGRGAYNAFGLHNPGTVRADSIKAATSSGIITITIDRPAPGSINAVLDEVDGLGYILDLRTAPPPVRAWLEQPRPFQMGFGSAVNDSAWLAQNTLSVDGLTRWFDVVIHLREVSAGRK